MKKMRVSVNGVAYDVEVEILEDDEAPGTSYGFPTTPTPPAGMAHAPAPPPPRSSRPPSGEAGGVLESPIAGTVVEVKVKPGAQVSLNEPILVVEAMKMNTNVSSPTAGRVREVLVKAGDHVVQGQPLVRFE